MSNFLPEGYEKPSSTGGYLKLEQGDNKLRILSHAITGYIVWSDKKPHRFKDFASINIKPSKEGDKAKHFWIMKIWDYKSESVKIWEVTQMSILDYVIGIAGNSDYGDPRGYDLTITRTGEMLETNYIVMPSPPKEISKEVAEADKEKQVNLDALYSGGDPYASEEAQEAKETFKENDYPAEIKPEDLPY